MPITMSTDNRDAILNMILVVATRQRDIPKFQEWVLSLARQIVLNKVHPAVTGPIAIDDYASGNMVDFNSDPFWGSGTIFTIDGSARNDGLFTIASKVNKTSIGNIEFASNMARITFMIDPEWTVGMNFTIAGSALNNFNFTIAAVIRNGVYTVTGHAVANEVADSVTATNGGFLYQVVEAIDTTNLSIPFTVLNFTTANKIELVHTSPDPDWLAGSTVIISGSDFFAGLAANAISSVSPDHVEFTLAPNPVLGVGFEFIGSEAMWTTPVINWRTGNVIEVDALYVDLPAGYTFNVVGEDRSEDIVAYSLGVVSTVVSGAAKGDGYAPGNILTVTQAGAALGTVTVTTITPVDGTTASFTAPSTITFGVDPAIAHPLCWGAGQRFVITGAADANNNQEFVIASNVGAAYVVTAVNLTSNVADAVAAVPVAGAVATVTLLAGGNDYTVANALATVAGGGHGDDAATVNITVVHSEVEFAVNPVYAAGTIFITHDSTTAGNDQTYTVVSNLGAVYTVTPVINTTEAGGVNTAGDIVLDQTYTVVSNLVAGRIVVTPAFDIGAILAGMGGDAGRAAVSDTFTVVGNVGAIYEVTPDPALTLPNSGHVAADRDGSFVVSAHVPGTWVYTLAAANWSTQGSPAATRVLTGANGVASTTIASISTPGGDWFVQDFLNSFKDGDFSTETINAVRHYYKEEFWTAPIVSFDNYGTMQLSSDPTIGAGHIVEIEGSTSNDGTYTASAKVNYVSTGNITFIAAGKHVVFATDPATITPPGLWVSGQQFTITGSLIGAPNNNKTLTIDSAAAAPDYTVLETIYNEGPIAAVAHSLGVTYGLTKNDGSIMPIIDFRAANLIRFAPNPNLDLESLIYVHGSTSNDGGYTLHLKSATATFAAADSSIAFSAALDPYTLNPTVWVPGAIIEVSGTALNNFPYTIVSYSAAAHKFIVTGYTPVNEASTTAVIKCGETYAHVDYTMHEAVAVEVAPIGCYGIESYAVQIDDFKAANVIEFLFDPHFAAETVIEVQGSTSNDGIYSVDSNAGVNYTMHETVAVEAALLVSVGLKKFVAEAGTGNIRSH